MILPTTLSDHPSLIGVVRFPKCSFTTNEVNIPIVIKNNQTYENWLQVVDMANTITSSNKESKAFTIPKNSITDFYPYTYYALTDGESEPLILLPQHLPSSVTFKSKFALSNQPIERFYPSNYKGDIEGRVYNITNVNQMMLPTGTNEGINYMNANANTLSQSRKGQEVGMVLNAITTIASNIIAPSTTGMVMGGANMVDGFMNIKESNARAKDVALTPNTISSFGTPSTRQAFNTDNVRLLKYSISELGKTKITNFCNRYGNKFNNYTTIDIRTYKGYLKMISPKIISDLDVNIIEKITSIFERGVYIE